MQKSRELLLIIKKASHLNGGISLKVIVKELKMMCYLGKTFCVVN